MYPKVKVRVVEVDDDDDNDVYDRGICTLRNFNSLTIQDVGPPGKDNKNASSLPVSKVPRSYMRRPMTPPHPLQQVSQMATSKKNEDGSKPQIRASSVPRPRAVVSSPDNDQLLGSKNKMRIERPLTLKSQNTTQSQHLGTSRNSDSSRCSSIATPWKPIRSEARPRETVVTTDHAREKKGSAANVKVPRANIVKSKPCFRVT